MRCLILAALLTIASVAIASAEMRGGTVGYSDLTKDTAPIDIKLTARQIKIDSDTTLTGTNVTVDVAAHKEFKWAPPGNCRFTLSNTGSSTNTVWETYVWLYAASDGIQVTNASGSMTWQANAGVLKAGWNEIGIIKKASGIFVRQNTAKVPNTLLSFFDDTTLTGRFPGAAVLTPMTKSARNALTAESGMMVYQSDNTPGLRVYNGSHWVKFSESNDD